MKFFKRYDRTEGDIFEKNIFMSVGKQTTLKEYDGWFIKLEIPLTFIKKYISIETFEAETGPCRLHLLYRHRPIGNHYFVKVWQPIEGNT